MKKIGTIQKLSEIYFRGFSIKSTITNENSTVTIYVKVPICPYKWIPLLHSIFEYSMNINLRIWNLSVKKKSFRLRLGASPGLSIAGRLLEISNSTN